jgi:hypothetical protein
LLDGPAAARAAGNGDLVLGGAKAPGNGHVVVIVAGPLNRGKYPYAFWGQYHAIALAGMSTNVGFTRGHGTVNWAFKPPTLDSLTYAAFSPLELLMPRAGPNEGLVVHTFT